MEKDRISFIGGDKRTLFAAREFTRAGFKVRLSGFDKLQSYGDLILTDVNEALSFSDIIVLPVSGLKNGGIPCVFSDKEIRADESFVSSLSGKQVFTGKADRLVALGAKAELIDILGREDFAVMNALPTAEGAVMVAIQNYEGVICGSNCLVIGYGRIGRVLSRLLRNMGANVTVSTRDSVHAACISSDGNIPVNTNNVNSTEGYDIVFNTVPALILSEAVLRNSDSDTLIIDLASFPGGVDLKAAENLDFTVIRAEALPGRYSPQSSGRALFNAILTELS